VRQNRFISQLHPPLTSIQESRRAERRFNLYVVDYRPVISVRQAEKTNWKDIPDIR
jgi:hypothetical protein